MSLSAPQTSYAAAVATAFALYLQRNSRKTTDQRSSNPVWVCGEVLIDRLPAEDGGDVVGGGAANTAKAVARIGLNTQFIDGLSSDEYGTLAKADLRSNNVNLDLCLESDQPTCLATVTFDENRKASYEFLIDGTATFAFDKAWLPDPLVHKPVVLHLGTLATIIEPGASVIYEWAAAMAKQGVPIVFDPNVRPTVAPDRSAYQKAVERFAKISSVVKASDDDLMWLYPDTPLLEVAQKWLESDVTCLAVITKGENGLMSVAKDGTVIRDPALKIDLKDTVGAGDTVGAMLVEGVVKHGMQKLVADADCLRAVLKRANRASAFTCSHEGCHPPTLADLEGEIKK